MADGLLLSEDLLILACFIAVTEYKSQEEEGERKKGRGREGGG